MGEIRIVAEYRRQQMLYMIIISSFIRDVSYLLFLLIMNWVTPYRYISAIHVAAADAVYSCSCILSSTEDCSLIKMATANILQS